MKKVSTKLLWIAFPIGIVLVALDIFGFVSVWENHALASSSAWVDFTFGITSLTSLFTLIIVVVLKRSQPPPPPPPPNP